jgi:hypothetical protein
MGEVVYTTDLSMLASGLPRARRNLHGCYEIPALAAGLAWGYICVIEDTHQPLGRCPALEGVIPMAIYLFIDKAVDVRLLQLLSARYV